MLDIGEAVRRFLGPDPLAGEDAARVLLARGADVLPAIFEGGPWRLSHQVEMRLEALTRALGPAVAPRLAQAIVEGDWDTKQAAAMCFGGLPNSDATAGPLTRILEGPADRDSKRLAVEALGRLGAEQWAFEIEAFAKTGDWNEGPARSVGRYELEKFSSYAIDALARFAAGSEREYRRNSLYAQLHAFVELRQRELQSDAMSAYDIVAQVAHVFAADSVDSLIREWDRDPTDSWRHMTLTILAEIRSVRSAKFLLEVAMAEALPSQLRTSASIALGELRDPRVAERLAAILRNPDTDKSHLGWAFSTLRLVPIDWSGLDEFSEQVLWGAVEPASQLDFALACRGDSRRTRQLVDRLDARTPYERWTAALSLARLQGGDSRSQLEGRASEAVDVIERCAILAAMLQAGDASQAAALHAALQDVEMLPIIRSIWRIELVGAFQHATSFDPRAFEVWSLAVKLSPKTARYLEHSPGLEGASPRANTVGTLTGAATPKEDMMLELVEASQIASIAGNAVSIIDKIYTQFISFRKKTQVGSAPSSTIVDEKKDGRISSIRNGQVIQSVSYEELRQRLTENDLLFIKAKEKALNNQYKIWAKSYPSIRLMTDPVQRATAELSLEQVADEIGTELRDILTFLEKAIGLPLDDHYRAIREVAGRPSE